MPLSPDKLANIVLNRRTVFGLDIDSRIRKASNHLSARAFFELFAILDDQSPDFANVLKEMLATLPMRETGLLIGFASPNIPTVSEDEDTSQPVQPTDYFLKLIFSSEEAAYYQFDLFPNLNAACVLGAARKRSGATQHIRVTLDRSESLQSFIESCRKKPHFVRVEESSEDEFKSAPSNAI